MKLLEPMPISTAPAASSCGTFTPGPPWMMRHVQAALGVLAGGQRLVEAAVLGLGAPVGGEADRRQPVRMLDRRRRFLTRGDQHERRQRQNLQTLHQSLPGKPRRTLGARRAAAKLPFDASAA